MSAHKMLADLFRSPYLMDDPDNGGTITVNQQFAVCPIVSAGAETRTLAQPTKAGLYCSIVMDTYGGAVTLTVTGGYNQAATTSAIFNTAGDFVIFHSAKIGASYYWRVVSSEGVTLLGGENLLSGVTAGTVSASKALVVDANKALDVLTISKLKLARQTLAAHTSLASTCTAALLAGLNVVSATATDSGGVKMPTPEEGVVVLVKNDAASTVWVFGNGASINGLATATGFPVATTKTTILVGDTLSRWVTFPLAVA